MPGLADARHLPDPEFEAAWASIILPADLKARLTRQAATVFTLRPVMPFELLPLHGVLLLTGEPGVGKTTVARGLADRVARVVEGIGEFIYVELDPHALTSSSLGRSQRAVEHLFSEVLEEEASIGPLIVLIDEIETIATDRSQLSLETNPVDVIRAVDAALVGLDRLARRFSNVLLVATSNLAGAIDPALRSRADFTYDVPRPDADARREILHQTLSALAESFPGARPLVEPAALKRAVQASGGLDGRRLRKAVAAACSVRAEAQANPDLVTIEDLLVAIRESVEDTSR
jgi:SpoVK/Ycf46/Vps4 family AAA+-type ATPase